MITFLVYLIWEFSPSTFSDSLEYRNCSSAKQIRFIGSHMSMSPGAEEREKQTPPYPVLTWFVWDSSSVTVYRCYQRSDMLMKWRKIYNSRRTKRVRVKCFLYHTCAAISESRDGLAIRSRSRGVFATEREVTQLCMINPENMRVFRNECRRAMSNDSEKQIFLCESADIGW